MSRNLKNVNYNDDYDESEDELSKEKSTLFQEFEQRVEFLTTQTNQLQPQQSQQVQQQQIMPNQLHQNQPMNMRQLHQNQLMQQIPMQIPQHNQFFLGFDVPKIFQSVPMQKHQEVNLLMHNITNGLIPSNEFVARLQLLMNGGNQKVIPIMPNPTSNFQIKIEKDQKRPQPVENNSIPPPKRVKQNSRPTSKTQAPMPKLATPNPNTESGASTPQPASASVKEVDLDLEGMMDVTNYAGVNLKDEESALNDMGTGNSTMFIKVVVFEKSLNICRFWIQN